MTEENGSGDAVQETAPAQDAPKPKRVSNFFPISLRKEVIARVDAMAKVYSMKRAEYVNNAVLIALTKDEAPEKKEEVADEPVQEQPRV
jgi:hypothetical protein